MYKTLFFCLSSSSLLEFNLAHAQQHTKHGLTTDFERMQIQAQINDGTKKTALKGAIDFLVEDFESGALPANWALFDVDGNTPPAPLDQFNAAWIVSPNFRRPGFSLQSTSFYDPFGQADDWVISPLLSITDDVVLKWTASTFSPSASDGYEVYVSTTTQDVAGCSANVPVFFIAEENAELTDQVVELSAAGYSNQDIYICFRNNSVDRFILQIDDISVVTPFENNMRITSAITPNEYTSATHYGSDINLQLGVDVINDGLLTQNELTVIADILNGDTVVASTETTVSRSLAFNETSRITLDPVSISGQGQYDIRYTLQIIGVTDQFTDDNIFVVENAITLTDQLMSRDVEGLFAGSFSIGGSLGGQVGQEFTLDSAANLSGINFSYTTICITSCPLRDLDITTSVFAFDQQAELPGELIATSNAYTVPDGSQFGVNITLMMPELVTLPAGRYIAAVNQPVAPDAALFIDLAQERYTPLTGWIREPGDINPGWKNAESVSLESPFVIRLLLSDPTQTDLIFSNGFE